MQGPKVYIIRQDKENMPIPMTLFIAILGIISISVFYFQNKKQSKFTRIYLVTGIILILIVVILWIALLLQE